MHLLVLLGGSTLALSGSAAGSSSASGALTLRQGLAGSAVGSSAASATLALRQTLSGSAQGSSTASATLRILQALTGSAQGGSTASGSLSGVTTLYRPPAPTGWKSAASRPGPAAAFGLAIRSAGEG